MCSTFNVLQIICIVYISRNRMAMIRSIYVLGDIYVHHYDDILFVLKYDLYVNK